MSTWVALEPASATVEAGREATVWLRVRNTGDFVEEYHVDVVGDPALWCSVEPASLRLYPGTTGSACLTFAPPRSPDATAGPHPYGVRVRPAEVPDAVTVPEGSLSVMPFVDIKAELVPSTVRGWRHATPRLVVDNYGNVPVTASVVAGTSGDRLDFDIRTPSFQVPPGRAYFSVLKLRPERLLWLGRKVSHPFTATVRPSGAEPATVSGTYIQSALLPTWVSRLGMLLTGLIAALTALWLLTEPAVATLANAGPIPTPSVSATPHPTATPSTAPSKKPPTPSPTPTPTPKPPPKPKPTAAPVPPAPPPTGFISVADGSAPHYIDIPNTGDTSSLTMGSCTSAAGLPFQCDFLDTAPDDGGSQFYNNQQWQVTSAWRASSNAYLVTIASAFTNFTNVATPPDIDYISYLDTQSASSNVGLVPIGQELAVSSLAGLTPGGFQDQYWLLTQEAGGTWELTPWQLQSSPRQCLTYTSSYPNLALEACAPGDANQDWAITTTQS